MPTDPNTPPQQPAHLDHRSPVTEAMRHPHNPLVTRRGNPVDPPDPGGPFSRAFALITTIVLVAAVILWQNTPDDTKQRLFYGQSPPPAALSPDEPAPGNFGQVDLMGRIYLRGLQLSKSPGLSLDMTNFETPGMEYIPEDRVRLAMIEAEFVGEDPALKRLEKLRNELLDELLDSSDSLSTRKELILDDLVDLEVLYALGANELPEDQQQRLKDRYGYIGHVALTHDLPQTDPLRRSLTTGFIPIIIFLVIAGLLAIGGPLAGLVILILGSISFFSGRMKMRARIPRPGGSVFLETYTLFIAGFLVMVIGTFIVMNSANPAVAQWGGLSLLVQWLLLLTVFWGLIRGMGGREWRHAIGWHGGEGVFKEIGCGIIAYLACLPVYILGVVITLIILLTKQWLQTQTSGGVPPEPEPVSNPIFEMVSQGDLFTIILLFVLATTWAPIVEEAIFRGALYRHMRARLHWVAAGVFTALLFAFMHDYGPLMVAPLIALGFMFAFMREWRGSLIVPMTAHFIHNFTLVSLMIIFVQMIKDPM